MSQAPRDANQVTCLLATSSADGTTPVAVWADPVTHRILVDVSGVLTGWSTTGNAGLTAGTNFIGTTDSVAFVTKTAGVQRLSVSATANTWTFGGDGNNVTLLNADAVTFAIANNNAGGTTQIGGSNNITTIQGGTLNMDLSGAGTFNLATGGGSYARTINFATTNTSGVLTIGGTTTTGAMTFGQSTASNTISIGNANTANAAIQTINIGAGTPAGTGKAVITMGNTGGASSLALKAGTGGTTIVNNGVTFTWPTADGSSGQAMVTNASGVLSFASAGGGGGILSKGRSAYTQNNFGETNYNDFSSTSGNQTATETDFGSLMTKTGTLTNFYIDPFVNTLNAGSAVYTVMKNGSATALVVTIGFGSTTIAGDTTHTVSVVAGDRITVKIVTTGAAGINNAAYSLQVN